MNWERNARDVFEWMLDQETENAEPKRSNEQLLGEKKRG